MSEQIETTFIELQIQSLSARHPGLTESLSNVFYEAAQICLSRHHASPIVFSVTHNQQTIEAVSQWDEPSSRTSRSQGNQNDATEYGACAISIAALEITTDFVVTARMESLSGGDFYIAPKSSIPNDFEEDYEPGLLDSAYKLEVSGIDEGSQAVVSTRLRNKIQQTQDGNCHLPAIASVVEFSNKIVVSTEVTQP